jgi:hypothetical protein
MRRSSFAILSTWVAGQYRRQHLGQREKWDWVWIT